MTAQRPPKAKRGHNKRIFETGDGYQARCQCGWRSDVLTHWQFAIGAHSKHKLAAAVSDRQEKAK